MLKTLLALIATAGSASPSLAQAQVTPVSAGSARMLYGHWQVVGVAVSDVGVQAVAANDPSYMGRRLTFTPSRLSWDRQKDKATEAPCASPTFASATQDADPEIQVTIRKLGAPSAALSVRCATGTWGPMEPPAATFLRFRDGTIGLWWYDGGLLRLRRVAR